MNPADKMHVAVFSGGPLDGVGFPGIPFIEKVVIQAAGGRTYRYESGEIGETGECIICKLELTRNREDFDAELREEEAKS